MKEITKLRIVAVAMIVFLVLGSWLTYDEKREQFIPPYPYYYTANTSTN